MTNITNILIPAAACIFLLGLASTRGEEPAPPATAGQAAAQTQTHLQSRHEVEKQRQAIKEEADKSLDPDAVAAIEETHNAIKMIEDGQNDQAMSAIERAIGKINVLVARNPAAALLPVAADVRIIDAAPLDVNEIKRIGKAADKAVDERDYPAARVLLECLTSEIRLQTFHLPLATYPVALREAARLLDQKQSTEAGGVLLTALNTLVVIEQATPLPLLVAQTAITEAEARRDNNKQEAQTYLAVARDELDRARELGYAGKDPEYASLNQTISDLEKQLNGNENTGSAFTRLKEKISSFFKRQSSSQKKAEVAER